MINHIVRKNGWKESFGKNRLVESPRRNHVKKPLAWLPTLLWMAFIFSMSAATGEESSAQSGLIVNLLAWAYGLVTGGAQPSPDWLDALSFLVRKCAHMTEYAVLALLCRYALVKNGASRPGIKALCIAALYACTDELHQAFVPDRGPSPVDVMIDTAGAFLGLVSGHVFSRIFPRSRS